MLSFCSLRFYIKIHLPVFVKHEDLHFPRNKHEDLHLFWRTTAEKEMERRATWVEMIYKEAMEGLEVFNLNHNRAFRLSQFEGFENPESEQEEESEKTPETTIGENLSQLTTTSRISERTEISGLSFGTV